MEVFQVTSRKRETYEVRLQYSVLWECALGIAAITNELMIDTLEKDRNDRKKLKQSLSTQLLNALKVVEENNTWKCLLQLLHKKSFTKLEELTSYITQLDHDEFKWICLPFVGSRYQSIRETAAQGDEDAIRVLQRETKENSFFPRYIQYVIDTEADVLKEHLIQVMTMWYTEVVKRDENQLQEMLAYDYKEKMEMKEKTPPEKFVQWATGGIQYQPEPSVQTVLLIPQYVYRPWNIEADIEGTKVFYYPISNRSIAPRDPYMPRDFLVEKHKALGDETRLRIVKMLSEEDHTLQQLTDRLHVGKSTIHHHLKLLRAAKLVMIENGKYVLKTGSLQLLTTELELYINE